MLVICPSCGKRVSDRAGACPFCNSALGAAGIVAATPPPAPSGRSSSPVDAPPAERVPPARKRSPWVYIGLGCGGILVLGLMAVGAGAYFLKRKVAEFKEQATNPQLRESKAAELLHTSRLPEGYFAIIAMSMPFALETVLLGDRPPQSSGKPSTPDQRGFLYMRMKREPANVQMLRAFIEGQTDDTSAFKANGIDLATKGIIRRSSFGVAGGAVRYVAQRGAMSADGGGGQGLQVVTLTDCPDQNLRMGIWFGPDPDPRKPVTELDLTGTVADEAELRRFLSHFRLCGSS